MMRGMMGNGWYGDWNSMPDAMRQTMQQYWGGARPFLVLGGLLDFITQILFIVLLVAAIRWIWKKGEK